MHTTADKIEVVNIFSVISIQILLKKIITTDILN